MDDASDGALVATISKKRRDGTNHAISPAKFDINVGEGKYLNLNDPDNVNNLDADTKNEALNQLKILYVKPAYVAFSFWCFQASRILLFFPHSQDQMANIMQQLEN